MSVLMQSLDPAKQFKFIGDYLLAGRGQRIAVLVVDFAGSTARKEYSASTVLALQHILFHNLLALRACHRGVLCKLTGDGCILSFPEARFGTIEEACRAAAREAVEFSSAVNDWSARLKQALDGSETGIPTKCALHVGEAYLVNYSDLYNTTQNNDELRRIFPQLSATELSPTAGDPHGSPIDLAHRILAHTKKDQILASDSFCQVLGAIASGSRFEIEIN